MSDLFELAIRRTIDSERAKSMKWIDNLHDQLGLLVAKRRAIRSQIAVPSMAQMDLAQYLGSIQRGRSNN